MRPFKTPEASLIVTTDASETGWGFHTSEGQEGQGLWSPFWAARHINLLEFLAVYLALKAVRLPPHSTVLVRTDNSTVVNCLRRGGSPRSVPLNQMTLAVVRLVEKRGWFLDQSHVSGNYNVRADLLSRGVPIATEWTLDLASLHSLWKLMSTLPQVDLFATPSNHRLDVFVTPISMEGAWSTDALSLDWDEWKVIYLFPPTRLIFQALTKLRRFHGEAMMIAPWWPTQAWFPSLVAQSKRSYKIRQPVLTQVVNGEIAYAPRCWTEALHAWIF